MIESLVYLLLIWFLISLPTAFLVGAVFALRNRQAKPTDDKPIAKRYVPPFKS